MVGPTVSDNAIVLAELTSADELPQGWGVDVGPGHYRLRRRDDDALFGHSAGPQSWKQFLHPPRQKCGRRDGTANPRRPRGMPSSASGAATWPRSRCSTACSGNGAHPDDGFVGRLGRIFVVAVNCTEPGGLCFCASMGTGPAVGPGYDLALTERIDDDGRRYVVDVGSDDGADVLAALPHRDADRAEIDSAHEAMSPRPRTRWAGRCRRVTCVSC